MTAAYFTNFSGGDGETLGDWTTTPATPSVAGNFVPTASLSLYDLNINGEYIVNPPSQLLSQMFYDLIGNSSTSLIIDVSEPSTGDAIDLGGLTGLDYLESRYGNESVNVPVNSGATVYLNGGQVDSFVSALNSATLILNGEGQITVPDGSLVAAIEFDSYSGIVFIGSGSSHESMEVQNVSGNIEDMGGVYGEVSFDSGSFTGSGTGAYFSHQLSMGDNTGFDGTIRVAESLIISGTFICSAPTHVYLGIPEDYPGVIYGGSINAASSVTVEGIGATPADGTGWDGISTGKTYIRILGHKNKSAGGIMLAGVGLGLGLGLGD